MLEFSLLGNLPLEGMGLVGWVSLAGMPGLEPSGFPGLPSTVGGSVTTVGAELLGFNPESFAASSS